LGALNRRGWTGSKVRVFFCVLTAIIFSVLISAGSAFSQEVDAQVPIVVNVAAEVKIDPPVGGGIGAAGSVTGGAQQTFSIKLAEQPGVSVSHRPQKQARAGAWVSHTRRNVTLNLPPQQYQNAVISLHSVNGKRILYSNASAAKGTASISRANIPAGVYLLSAKGTKGNTFTTRLTHSGEILNINVAFGVGGGDKSSLSKGAAANIYGEWTITVSATGYGTQTRTFFPVAGANEPQSFTLASNSGEDGYTLSVTRNPTAGGKVFVGNVESTGTTLHNAEAQVAVRAEAAVGYVFSGWSGASTSTNATITVNMRTNVTLTANFLHIGTSKLTIVRNPAEGGKVFVNDVESAGVTYHNKGAQVGVRAAASAGYIFTGWEGGISYPNAPLTLVMDTDVTITANFKDMTFTDPRDGKVYYTTEIGGDVWMAENLNFSAHVEGDSWCYNNTPDNCAEYGRLYTWNAAMTACPVGWNLPTNDDWSNLVFSAGGSVAGTKLKSSSSGWSDWGGTDDFDFSALPGGRRLTAGSFNGIGSNGYWWSATGFDVGNAYYREMSSNRDSNNSNVSENTYTKTDGISVRCLIRGGSGNRLVVTASPPAGGIVTPTLMLNIATGTPVNISASVNSNYNFVNWTVTSGTAIIANANDASTTVTLSSNATIRANFQHTYTIDSRDGREYRTVTIGTKTWMAENLNYNASGSVCYNNQVSNCNTYGRLYDWATVMRLSSSCNSSSCASQVQSKHQGICPTGWHVPSDGEWETLVKYVDPNATENSSSIAGTKLKSTTGWSSGGNGTDDYVFSALPGGYGSSGGNFDYVGNYGYWWSATEYSASFAWVRGMDNNYDYVGRFYGSKTALFYSLRCVRDSAAPQ